MREKQRAHLTAPGLANQWIYPLSDASELRLIDRCEHTAELPGFSSNKGTQLQTLKGQRGHR